METCWRMHFAMRFSAPPGSGISGRIFRTPIRNGRARIEHTKKLLDEKEFVIEHVDAVVITEKPKLGPHFPKMREALARALGVPAEKIHLKAKTNEGVDAIGRGEAIAAHVVATISGR